MADANAEAEDWRPGDSPARRQVVEGRCLGKRGASEDDRRVSPRGTDFADTGEYLSPLRFGPLV